MKILIVFSTLFLLVGCDNLQSTSYSGKLNAECINGFIHYDFVFERKSEGLINISSKTKDKGILLDVDKNPIRCFNEEVK